MTTRRSSFVAAALAVVAAAWVACYLGLARGYVIDSYGHGERWIIKNILAGQSAVTLPDYLDVADRLAWMIAIALAGTALVLFAWRFAEGLTGNAYNGLLRAADAVLARRRAAFVASGVLCVGALAAIALFVLQDFPNSGDEYSYLYEADTIVHGRTSNPAHPLQPFFEFTWVRQAGDRVFSIFPPGWPAVLAAARLARLPLWLVNPVMGWLSLVVLFLLGRRLYGERTALLAAGATFASSFFLLNGGSYFSHTICSLQILAVAYFGLRAIEDQRALFAALAGAAAGAALLTRNYSAAWCTLPFVWALARRGRFGLKALAAAGATGVPFVIAYLAYNASTMGHPFVTGLSGHFGHFDTQFFPSYWIARAFENLGGRIVSIASWTPPALAGLYGWWWLRTPRSAWRFTDFIFPCLVFGYFIYMDRGGNRYGPRFWYDAFPLMVLAATSMVTREPSFAEKPPSGRFATYLFAASMLACLPLFAWHAANESRVIWARREPFRLAGGQKLDHAVVFLSTRTGGERSMSAKDLTRNGADQDGPVLFVLDLGPENEKLMRYYPDRSFYRYRFDRSVRQGFLEPLDRVAMRWKRVWYDRRP